MLAYSLFQKTAPKLKQVEHKVFYVRWGGIPNWDPKSKTLKKANTWGMGSGGYCLTSLHENKIREIVSYAVATSLIDNSNFALHTEEILQLSDEIVRYQIDKQRADKKFIAWTAPHNWTPVMSKIALTANEGVDRMFSSMKKEGIFPLLYTEREYQLFYYEYCNKRLWPLFHKHLTFNKEQKKEKVNDIFEVAPCHTRAFEEYIKLSLETAKTIAEKAEYNGLVWLHDYHLLLIPEHLKKLRPDLKLGYHFHVPIPNGKLIQPLDEDIKRLITSVMQCDYLSFNTKRDMENLIAIATEMGLDTKRVIFQNNPIGVEPVKTLETNPQPNTKTTIEEIKRLREEHAKLNSESSFQVIFSVDRIEPSKGLKTRLKAIGDIVESSSMDAGHLLFVMVCPDSRTGIKSYDDLNKWFKEEIKRLNSLSNQKIGRDIIKFHSEMPQTELQTLGHHADIFMVTSDADGLHLGPVEWLATRSYHDKNKQVDIILSTGAGVSEYFPHALTFNPKEHDQLTSLLYQTTIESNIDKVTRSDAIKRDFFDERNAQGFRLSTWRENAAKGLAAESGKIHTQSARKRF